MLDEARLAYQQGRYDDCYGLVTSVEDHDPINATLLILKGRCVQLIDDGSVPLEESHKAFTDALLIDPESIDALLELGYYHLNVQDDPQSAKPFFERVVALLQARCVEAIQGTALYLSETEQGGREALAIKCLVTFTGEIEKEILAKYYPSSDAVSKGN